MIKTFQYRIKDSNKKKSLSALAGKVNFVWNYFNETSNFAIKRDSKYLTEFDLNRLSTGSSQELGLSSTTINAISARYVFARNRAKKSKLRWRSKKSLGWIPIGLNAIKVNGDSFVFQKQTFRFWKTREIKGILKCASINEDASGNWFINFSVETDSIENHKPNFVGIDLGLKSIATLSNGYSIKNPKTLQKFSKKLANAQRAKKKKQVIKIYKKIKNIRKDFLHKESSKIVKDFNNVFIGDVSSNKLAKTKMAKSVLDAGWGKLKQMLEYKAIALGGTFKVINEKYSTVTCSGCLERSGPSGLSALEVREWTCSNCGSRHDRDHNSAINILRLGHQALERSLPGCSGEKMPS